MRLAPNIKDRRQIVRLNQGHPQWQWVYYQ